MSYANNTLGWLVMLGIGGGNLGTWGGLGLVGAGGLG